MRGRRCKGGVETDLPLHPRPRKHFSTQTTYPCKPNRMSTSGKVVALLVALFTIFGIYYFQRNIVGERSLTGLTPTKETEYIIDADTANEVDDLFAIIGAIARDDRGKTGPRLAGLTAAQFHTSPLASNRSAEESQVINEQLAQLMGRPQLRTLVGTNRPLESLSQPRKSPAAAFIAERASRATPSNKLQVFVLGPCTNVASAILLDPELASVIHVRYLGFWYDPATGTYDKDEFNTGNDPIALNYLLDNPALEFTVMTATTSESLQFTREELDTQLPANHRLTNYLKNRWDTYDRWWTEEDPTKRQWTMWDVASLEAWFEPQWATLEKVYAPEQNFTRKIGIYTAIEADSMKATYWEVVRAALETME